jgi:hypothetical protein
MSDHAASEHVALSNALMYRKSRMPSRTHRLSLALAVASLVSASGCRKRGEASPAPVCSPDAAVDLYQRKIEPVLKDDHPTSCNQCHLSGIDLSLFVRDTPCQTMACLKQLALVDFERPEQSKVLTWIKRAKPESTLITADVIDKEYQGFLEWIRYSASCGQSLCESFDDPCGEERPDAAQKCDLLGTTPGFSDPGDCGELTLEQLFAQDIFAWRERCFPCHFTSDHFVAAPKWIDDVEPVNQDPALACPTGSLESMRNVLARGFVDLELPSQSLLLLKPLSTEGGGVVHGGGAKFDGPSDPSYQSFLAWITRYAACTEKNPALEKAAAPPPLTQDSDAGAPSPVFDYCNCVLKNCHDQAHLKWGPTDEELIAGCRTEALALPKNGGATMSGNFFECRAAYCAEAATTAEACSAALGETGCQ